MNSIAGYKRRRSDVDKHSPPYRPNRPKQPRCIPESNDAGSEITNQKKLTSRDYTVGWVAALAIERAAAEAMLDDHHQKLSKASGDTNNYTFGEIGGHNVVIASLPHDGYGTINAATVAGNMHRTFPSLEVFLMVGIAGGAPAVDDVRLGDVVVSTKLIQYDLGKALGEDRFETTAIPLRPAHQLRTAVTALQARYEAQPSKIPAILSQIAERNSHMESYTSRESLQDLLFESTYEHPVSESTCNQCDQSRLVKRISRRSNDPMIHYGVIASGDQVIKYATTRDELSRRFEALCFEMEGAGFIESLQCLVIRSICDYADSHKNKQWQRYAAATAAAYTKELLGEMPVVGSQASKIELPMQRSKDLMGSLAFPSMCSREENIRSAYSNTCEWVLRHPIYLKWLSTQYPESQRFLWIRGKPGVGKSTLMKFISTDASMHHNAVVTFFFNARGEELEKSIEGMYRSLLLQLLEKFHLSQFLDHPYLRRGFSSTQSEWDIGILQGIFSRALAELGGQELMFFIDALDECRDSDVQGMVDFFEQQLCKIASEQNVTLLVCFSSRHYPTISIRTNLTFVLEDQNGHGRDLEEYVSSQLKVGVGESALEIESALLRKAAGVFLWAVLVIRILNEEYLEGRIYSVKRRLDEIPAELSAVFCDILKKDSRNEAEVLLSIQWILYARYPLTPDEYYYAIVAGLSQEEDELAEWDHDQITIDSMNRFVSSSSKGLAEVTKSEDPKVQFIHESVRDFFLKDVGIYTLWPDIETDFQGRSHDRLKECCYAYIKAQSSNIEALVSKFHRHIQEVGYETYALTKLPFFEYAGRNVFYHADMAAASVSQQDFLKTFDLRAWIWPHNEIWNYVDDRYTLSANIFYVLADHGHARLIDNAVAVYGPMVHVRGEVYEYPLFAAMRSSHDGAVDAILRAGEIRVDSVNSFSQLPPNCDTLLINGYTPLTLAIDTGYTKIVQLLLDQGLDPNVSDSYGRIPLHPAIDGGHNQITRLLLDKGADINLRNDYGETPLHIAFKHRSSEEILLLLLKEGADINSKDNNGETPLHYAVTYASAEEISLLLLKEGADINSKANNGETPLHYAVKFASVEENRTNLNANDMHSTVKLGYTRVVKLLLESGADVNVVNGYGETPLQVASEYRAEGMMELLLAHSARFQVLRSKRKYWERC